MLSTLRRKFVVIIMALVGTVLVSVLGGSFFSTWQTQQSMIDETLARNLYSSVYEVPRMATKDNSFEKDSNQPFIPVLKVDVDQNWVVVATNNAPFSIDSTVLSDVLDEARKSESDEGSDATLHVFWRRKLNEDGSWRIVIADATYMYYSLSSLAIKDLAITAVAMVALLIISIGLSTWVLKPVQEAWDQQRRFVADASHELKTPLAVIIANTQILSKDTTIGSESRRWIESTAEESTHMKNLVEELLELARTDESSAGTSGVMQSVDIDFSELVESAALEFDAIAFEHGCTIEDDVDEGIHVTGDPEWLSRLAKILIDNACKYSRPESPITVRLSHNAKRCTLSVNNKGQTIDPEDLAHIFDRFYRTDKARSRDAHTGGFGLGLAIAKGIATSHNGTISATSTDEDGTTFTVVLPCA